MKTRKAIGPCLLLLSLAIAPSLAREKAFDAELLHAGASDTRDYPIVDVGKGSSSTNTKSNVGTKDAPVDGLDGKPHKGPFVETSPDESRKKAASDSLTSTYDSTDDSESSLSSADKSSGKLTGSYGSLAEAEGVMGDKSGRAPATGHTGTEGGVSEKEKDRKALDKLGVGKGKTPDSPKEPVDLPDTIEDRIDLKEKTEKSSASQKASLDEDKSWNGAGLEVSD